MWGRALALGVVFVAVASSASQISRDALRFPGGYVNLPQAEQWREQQLPSPGSAAFRLITPTQSIAATVQYQVASSNVQAFAFLTQGRQMLLQAVENTRKSFGQSRYKLHFFESMPADWKNGECLDYRAELDDLEFPGDPGTAYPLRVRGRFCILKDQEGLFLVFLKLEYSERRSSLDQPYTRYEAEAREYLEGIVVER